MLKFFDEVWRADSLRAIDRHFAKFIAEQVGGDSPLAGWALLVSFEAGKGNVCVDLNTLSPHSLFDLPTDQSLQVADWLQFSAGKCALLDVLYQDAKNVNSKKSSNMAVISDGSLPAPLVFDGQRLYLYRSWQAEQTVAKHLSARAIAVSLPPESRAHLDRLFDDPSKAKSDEVNWQKVAAACALSFRFAVISGGPGTGKTTTVTKLLAALIQSSEKAPVIKMVAPTGKAANRLTESIGNAVGNLDVAPSVREQIPRQASTIHRLLGSQPNTNAFRHNAKNPLQLDVLVVDEASMVDLGMMASLLNALPAHA
ncbi:MAG: AAA family ATPase, partial [Enterovibrio sp.]